MAEGQETGSQEEKLGKYTPALLSWPAGLLIVLNDLDDVVGGLSNLVFADVQRSAGEPALDAVDRGEVAVPHILVGAVVNRAVTGKLLAEQGYGETLLIRALLNRGARSEKSTA